jgi:hypothetical protein
VYGAEQPAERHVLQRRPGDRHWKSAARRLARLVKERRDNGGDKARAQFLKAIGA